MWWFGSDGARFVLVLRLRGSVSLALGPRIASRLHQNNKAANGYATTVPLAASVLPDVTGSDLARLRIRPSSRPSVLAFGRRLRGRSFGRRVRGYVRPHGFEQVGVVRVGLGALRTWGGVWLGVLDLALWGWAARVCFGAGSRVRLGPRVRVWTLAGRCQRDLLWCPLVSRGCRGGWGGVGVKALCYPCAGELAGASRPAGRGFASACSVCCPEWDSAVRLEVGLNPWGLMRHRGSRRGSARGLGSHAGRALWCGLIRPAVQARPRHSAHRAHLGVSRSLVTRSRSIGAPCDWGSVRIGAGLRVVVTAFGLACSYGGDVGARHYAGATLGAAGAAV